MDMWYTLEETMIVPVATVATVATVVKARPIPVTGAGMSGYDDLVELGPRAYQLAVRILGTQEGAEDVV